VNLYKVSPAPPAAAAAAAAAADLIRLRDHH